MKLIPVTLGAARSTGGSRSSKQGNTASDPGLEKKIFERDNYTCRCCGFRAQKYQSVLSNVDTGDDSKEATACIFCHQAFNLDKVSKMRSGVLIWLPEISQPDLQHIARAVYVARISQGPVADSARQVLDILMTRREEVRNRLGTDDPFILATVLQDYISSHAYKMRSQKLEGIRLFPLDRRIIKEADLEFNQFPQILAYWRSKDGPFGGAVPKQWLDIYRHLLKKQAA